MSARTHYDIEMEGLHEQILRMGGQVERSIEGAIGSLVRQDVAAAQKIIDEDDIIDAMKLAVEDKCAKIIATQQPLARDLRKVLAANQIATDLERMGDHAVDIAKVAIKLKGERYIKKLIDIPRMSGMAMAMVKKSLDSYVKEDADLAAEACKEDDLVDDLRDTLMRELFTYAIEMPKEMVQIINFMFVVWFLERIADHATNIGEWVIYHVTGEHKDLNP